MEFRWGTSPAERDGLNAAVIRGGSWNNNPQNLRSANRNNNTPTKRNNNNGFRCAKTLCRRLPGSRSLLGGGSGECAMRSLSACSCAGEVPRFFSRIGPVRFRLVGVAEGRDRAPCRAGEPHDGSWIDSMTPSPHAKAVTIWLKVSGCSRLARCAACRMAARRVPGMCSAMSLASEGGVAWFSSPTMTPAPALTLHFPWKEIIR